ncbi:hypothetical protein [Luteolibacter pohnpeiensis]|nr:hypothetical protein [Luteolibacter pohnpeiensis]
MAEYQQFRDQEHLNMLAIFHYVVAGILALASCIPVIHLTFGLFLVFNPPVTKGAEAFPPEFGWFIVIIACFFITIGWAVAIATFLSGRFISKRQNRMFSFVVACMICLFMPLGTILGVFTLIILSRDSVVALYNDRRIV